MLEYLRHEQASKCAMPADAAVQRCTTFCGLLRAAIEHVECRAQPAKACMCMHQEYRISAERLSASTYFRRYVP